MQKYDNESGEMVAAAGGDWCRAEDVDARIAELRQAFNRYGRHTAQCLDSGHRECICGYVDAYKSLMER